MIGGEDKSVDKTRALTLSVIRSTYLTERLADIIGLSSLVPRQRMLSREANASMPRSNPIHRLLQVQPGSTKSAKST